MDGYTPTRRTRVKRLPKRGHYDRETVYAILDQGVLCHVGYTIEGQPYVTPTSYWREGNRVYWHGSSASRMLRNLATGVPACFTVTLFDGFVLARSGFHHSINYRSVMALGMARLVSDNAEKLAALEAFMERLFPGRWRELRPVNQQELKGTTMLWMELEEVSAKVRTGPPIDDAPDYALPIWAGVLPVATALGALQPDPLLSPGVAVPKHLQALAGTVPGAVTWSAPERTPLQPEGSSFGPARADPAARPRKVPRPVPHGQG